MSKWIDVKDRLPENNEDVLVTTKLETIDIGWHSDGVWEIDYISQADGDIVAWMPLPEPYKKEVE